MRIFGFISFFQCIVEYEKLRLKMYNWLNPMSYKSLKYLYSYISTMWNESAAVGNAVLGSRIELHGGNVISRVGQIDWLMDWT